MLVEYSHNVLDACVALFMDVFKNEPWHYDWMIKENIARYITDMERTPCFKGMVYFDQLDQDKLVGFCFGVMSDYFASRSYEIKEIVVRRDSQHKGYGSKMLSEIEKHLKKCEVQVVTLATQREIPAYEYYLKNGYGVSEGAVFMSKMI